MASITVTSPDGVKLSAQEWGNPQGREILFLHGFNQCHLSWQRQYTDKAMAEKFRMVTFDLRGHGASDKPVYMNAYRDDKIWGDDVAALMKHFGLKRPVLVGWSYAGRVMADYLRTHGAANIAALNFVAARSGSDPKLFGAARKHFAAMKSEDLAENIEGTRAFLRACFERQPSEEDFEFMMGFNMVVPAYARTGVLGRPGDTPDAIAKLTCPVLVTHGAKDQIILPGMGEFTKATVKGAKLSMYDGVGHAPFWEDAARFNKELAELVESAK
jgi:pimeloyl-ACP methyl ester carboxylesterase